MRNSSNAHGFNLPSAYQSHDNKIGYMVVLAVFFISTICAATLGSQMIWG